MKQKPLCLFPTIAVLVLFSQMPAETEPGSSADTRTPESSLTETPERTVRQVEPSEDLQSVIDDVSPNTRLVGDRTSKRMVSEQIDGLSINQNTYSGGAKSLILISGDASIKNLSIKNNVFKTDGSDEVPVSAPDRHGDSVSGNRVENLEK